MNIQFSKLRGIEGFYPTFYKDLLRGWLNTDKKNSLFNTLDSNQIIWNNQLITYKGNVVYL